MPTITEAVHAELIRRTDGLNAHINESWHKFLDLMLIAQGQLNERKLAYALSVGAPVSDATGAALWLDGLFASLGAQLFTWDSSTETLHPLMTFTRSTTALKKSVGGNLEVAAINAPRFEFDAVTGAPAGLLIEEARTNSIRNSTMVGAVPGSPGTLPTNWGSSFPIDGLTYAVVGSSTEGGLAYLDIRVFGTCSASSNARIVIFEPSGMAGIAATPVESWALSVYVKLAAGTLAGVNSLNLRTTYFDGAGGTLSASLSASLNVTGRSLPRSRFELAVITPASTAFIGPGLQMSYTSGAVIDFTLRIGVPQLERGTFASSPIPTSTVAVTRAADICTVTDSSSFYNQSEGTIFAEWGLISDLMGTAVYQFSSDASNVNQLRYPAAGTLNTCSVITGGVNQVSMTVATQLTLPGTYRNAMGYKVNDFARSADGAAVVTDTVGTLPVITQLTVGQQSGAEWLNGYVRRLVYYPTRRTDAELQVLSS